MTDHAFSPEERAAVSMADCQALARSLRAAEQLNAVAGRPILASYLGRRASLAEAEAHMWWRYTLTPSVVYRHPADAQDLVAGQGALPDD